MTALIVLLVIVGYFITGVVVAAWADKFWDLQIFVHSNGYDKMGFGLMTAFWPVYSIPLIVSGFWYLGKWVSKNYEYYHLSCHLGNFYLPRSSSHTNFHRNAFLLRFSFILGSRILHLYEGAGWRMSR